LKAYKTAGDPVFTAHTIPLVVPLAEIDGVVPGKLKPLETEVWEDAEPNAPSTAE
jgi:hypothetical protein